MVRGTLENNAALEEEESAARQPEKHSAAQPSVQVFAVPTAKWGGGGEWVIYDAAIAHN